MTLPIKASVTQIGGEYRVVVTVTAGGHPIRSTPFESTDRNAVQGVADFINAMKAEMQQAWFDAWILQVAEEAQQS